METTSPRDGFGTPESAATAKADLQTFIEEPGTHSVPSEASQISRNMEKEGSKSSRNDQGDVQVDEAAVVYLKGVRLHLVTIA
jgi:hypothetical protein